MTTRLAALRGPAAGDLFRALPGLALSGLLAAAAMAWGDTAWLQAHGFSALTLAIALGILAGNTVYPRIAQSCGPGIAIAKQNLLRAGVVLYGLRLTVQDLGRVGLSGVLVDALVLTSTFALAHWIGHRWLGLDRKTTMLIGAGSSICGAAAVMATERVVKARAEQVTVAVATVVVFGTLSVLLYPLLFELNKSWGFIPHGSQGFGIYAGSTIHEVAQVLAAARAMDPAAADTALIAKMVRVMMLAPFLLILSAWMARGRSAGAGAATKSAKLAVPWFAFAFVAVVLVNSLHGLPSRYKQPADVLDTALLAMAMAALGLSTHWSAIRKAGPKPLLLALALFAWLVVGGAMINHGVALLLG
ncbi:MAG TPA: YeiH family protein [Methylibium sp.]